MASTPHPHAARAVFSEALAAFRRGDAAGAEALCRKAMAQGLDDAPAWTLLGIVLRHHDHAAAETAFLEAIARDPRIVDAPFQLANLYRQQHRYSAAIAGYDQALALAPDNPHIANNLALAFEAAGEPGRAIELWRETLARDPGHRQAQGNLVHALCRIGSFREAAATFERYLRGAPGVHASLWVDYGICRHRLRDYEGAEETFRHALAQSPDDPIVLTNLGSVLFDGGDHERAEPLLARALAVDPDRLYAATLLAACRANLCQWDGQATLHAAILDRVEHAADGKDLASPFTALTLPMAPAAQLRIARRWARSLLPIQNTSPTAPARPVRERGDRIRLGYISSDFRTHAVAFLATEVWERHDRRQFKALAYSIGPRETSPLRSRIEAAFDQFADCADENAGETARRIRADGIDVLIDLNGYTTHARSEILALRPAAVQVSWLGYLGTMGADFIDYVITDRIATPDGAQDCFAERLLALPHCYCPSDTRREVAAHVPTREACGLPPDSFVFCCFNAPYKIGPELFDAWMRVVGAVPGSVLWLAPGNATASANLRREAQRRGIDPGRLVVTPRVAPPEYLARQAHADLFLDTVPYNAGTTANDALFMGVPVLTCLGPTMAGRVAASQLHAIGLPELVAADLRDYEAIAVSISRDAGRLPMLKSKLAHNRATYPLFDMARFTRDLEATLIGVVR